MGRALAVAAIALLGSSLVAVTVQPAAPAAAAACTVPTTIPPAGGAPWPAGEVLAANGLKDVHTPAHPAIAWSPRAFGTDVVTRDPDSGVDSHDKHVTVAYSSHIDVVNPRGGRTYGGLVSADSGATFTPAAPETRPDLLGDVGSLLDGRLLGMHFIINGKLSFPGAEVRIPLVLHLSSDKGRSWEAVQAHTQFADSALPGNLPVRKISAIRGLRTAGRPIQMTNGTIVLPVYFTMDNGAGGTVMFQSVLTARPALSAGAVVTSAPWVFTLRPMTSNPAINFGESAVVERQDGALLAVTRATPPVPAKPTEPDGRLTYKVSTDSGATWSAIADVSFAGQPGCVVHGVAPALTLMPNGLLVLSSGRPGNWMAVSTDASGTSWTRQQTTYRNAPAVSWRYGSSGYTSLVPTGANQLLQFVDNCAAPNGEAGVNGCVAAGTYDRRYRLLHRSVSALTPDLGKIDLATKLRRRTATVTTDLTGAPPAGAVTPPTPYGEKPSAADATRTGYWATAAGAVDGSTAYWSGALSSRPDGTGTYQIELDRTYRLTKIGLALTPGAAATARVSTSADGTTWTPAPLRFPAGVPASAEPGRIDSPGDRALRYYPVDAEARHVRITTDAASCAAAGGPETCSMINELELYSTVNSFENEPNVPHGLADVACARVTQPARNLDLEHDSRYALRLKDSAKDLTYCVGADTQAKFSYPGPEVELPRATARTLQADIYPVDITTGILMSIRGTRSADGQTATAYQIGINDGGRWMVHTEAGRWAGLGGPIVPMTEWTRFKVVATTDRATLVVVDANGGETEIGPLPKQNPAVFEFLTGYSIASGGTDSTGDEAVFDDISFE